MPDNLNFFLNMQFYRSLACDPREFLTAIFTLRVLSCCLFVCLLFVLVQHVSLVLIKPKGLVIIYRGRRGRWGWAQDLWARRWILADLPFECYFPEVILPNNFWWLSRSRLPAPPPSHHMSSFSKQIWVVDPLNRSKVFSDPPFWVLSYDRSPGINNDRSLMCFSVIMQHANMVYHVQRAYKGPDHLTFEEGGYRWFQKNISWSLILSRKKSCKEIPAIQ